MAPRIVVVDDNPALLYPLELALTRAGYAVTALEDSLTAWDVIKTSPATELLITRVRLGPGKPHGVALAQWARDCCPDIQILFVALPEFESYTENLGHFVAMPVEAEDVVQTVGRMLSAKAVAEECSGVTPHIDV